MLTPILVLAALGAASAQADEPSSASASSVELPAGQHKKLLKEWGCDADSTSVELVGKETIGGFEVTGWQITGCGETFVQVMNQRRGMWSYGSNDKELRQRAPFDLSCDAGAVSYTYISSTTRGATGCGQKLTYVRVDQKWVANVAQ